jgi:hypothetical protein
MRQCDDLQSGVAPTNDEQNAMSMIMSAMCHGGRN